MDTSKSRNITVTGTAYNAKGGAILRTDEGSVYYIEGLDSWEMDIPGKKVSVIGILKTENFKEKDLKNEKGEWTQGMIGEKLSLVKAKWKLLE